MTGARRSARNRAATATLLAASVLLAPAGAAPAPSPLGGRPDLGHRAGRLVVHLAPGAEGASSAVAASVDGAVARRVTPGTVAVVVADAPAATRRLAMDPRVTAVEDDVVYRAAVEPNDPCLASCFGLPSPSQYGVRVVGGPEAWNVTRGRADILVAVLDSGVDSNHPELVGKVVHGANVSRSASPDDRTGHGTGIAGTIAAIPDNGEGIAGLGWNTRVLSVKVLDDSGEGFASDVAAGIRVAIASGARVVNLSLSGGRSLAVREAVLEAQRAGALVVAAAGNEGSGEVDFPAGFPRVLGVAATGRDDRLALFSNHGPTVELAAPGVAVLSTATACGQGCGYSLQSGTSSATPHVAAAAALLLSQSPAPNADEVRVRLTRGATITPDSGDRVQFGRLNVPGALAITGQGYRMVASDGGIFAFGESRFAGSTGGGALNQPIVGTAPTPTGRGYWLVGSDGGIFAFGDARFLGSTGAIRLNRPIVGMATTPTGLGYWLVASDGGIFSFGDAQFQGSTGGLRLNRPIVGMASTPSGEGYWLVASDGGIFSFGDAAFRGSTGALALNRPIVGMASTPSGEGYWLVASDGGIFNFGDARFFGSTGALALNQPIVGMVPTPSGQGYWLAARDGGVFNLGDARFAGSAGGAPLNRPVVGFAG